MLRAVRRNTELGLILLGTLVTVGAYVLASLAEDATIPANIGAVPRVVLGLQLAAHIAIRRLAPDADGTLLPIAGLLNGLGYVFIVRLDEAKADPKNLAGLQSAWVAVGIAAFIATLLVVRRVRDLERYRWTIGFLGIAPAAAPARARHRPRVLRRPDLGEHRADQLPARRVRQDPPGHLLRVLPGGEARAARGEQPPHRPDPAPRPQAPRAGAAGVGGVARRDDQPEGPRQLAAVLRPVRRAALGGHRAGDLPRRSALLLFAVRRRVRAQPVRRTCRTASTSGSTRGRTRRTTASRSSRRSSPSRPAASPAPGINLGSPTRIPLAETDFIFAAIGEELGLVGATARARSPTC